MGPEVPPSPSTTCVRRTDASRSQIDMNEEQAGRSSSRTTPDAERREFFLDLKGRGRIRAVEYEGPEAVPTLILLHGLGATGPLNWLNAFSDLAERYHVLAVDHRGHGRGIPTRRFRLKDCADDVVAVADALGIRQFIAVGYSMGGPIAKLCWSRHPGRVRGLVLCATARHFTPARYPVLTRAVLPGAVIGARVAPKLVLGQIVEGMVRDIPSPKARDYVRREMSGADGRDRHDPRQSRAHASPVCARSRDPRCQAVRGRR
jgi:pimeloyl-ACP methyl ester carboxylesterase